MKYKFSLIFLVFVLLSVQQGFAAFEDRGFSSHYLARGSTGIAAHDSTFAIFLNPSVLGDSPYRKVDLFYRNFYGLPDLNQIALSVSFPDLIIPIGIGLSQYGGKLYSEMLLRLGTGFLLFPKMHLGLHANGYFLSVQNYGNSQSFGLGISGFYQWNKNLSTGFMIDNVNAPTIGQAREALPITMIVGASYTFTDDLQFHMDIFKEDRSAFDYRLGVEYILSSWLQFSAGFQTEVPIFSTGFALFIAHFDIAYSFQYHGELGVSHSMSVGYEF